MKNIAFLVLSAFMFLACGAPEVDTVNSDEMRMRLKSVPELSVTMKEVRPDTSVKLVGISALTMASQQNLYILHRPESGDPVVVLDTAGNFIRSWGEGMFNIPHGIRIDPNGDVWTVDSNSSVVYKFSPEGELLLTIEVGGIPDPDRDFCGAADIAFAENGHIYVADGYCNGRIIEYDAIGQKVQEWGQRGTGDGEFRVVHSIGVGPMGNIYVADRENGRVQWFSPNGDFLGKHQYGGQLYSLAFDSSGELYITVRLRGGDRESYVIHTDVETGEMLGYFKLYGHELSISAEGIIIPATRNEKVLLYELQDR